jgi:hypothetical protein
MQDFQHQLFKRLRPIPVENSWQAPEARKQLKLKDIECAD